MNLTAPSIESLTLNIAEEIHVRASLEATFAALLDEIGPHNVRPDGTPMPLKLEPWPGGRWYRDLGNNDGHFWGHVQAIKQPALLEITGPDVHVLSGCFACAVSPQRDGRGNADQVQAFGAGTDSGRAQARGFRRLEPHSRPSARTSGGTVMTVVSQEEWLAARKDLLVKEKEFTRQRDALSAERRKLPWVKVEKEYVFDAPEGRRTLAELFGGRSQLIVYHFMLGPGWAEGCPSCSLLGDHFDGSLVHFAHRDVTLLAVSRAPLPQIEAFKRRMGWRFRWVSSYGNDFNRDYHVSFTKEELATGKVYYNYEMTTFPSEEAPGVSVFYKDGNGVVFHTYSSYARGLDVLIGVYNFLDLAPKGRNEEALKGTMAWVRHHDKYIDAVLEKTQ